MNIPKLLWHLFFLIFGWSSLFITPKSAQAQTTDIDSALTAKANFAKHVREEGSKCYLVYLPWYRASRNSWVHWDLFGHRPTDIDSSDIASAHRPLSGLYDSSDPSLIKYHIKLAKAIGIDGYIVHWEGGTIWHDKNIPLILKEAEKQGMTIALLYKTPVANGDRSLLKKHLEHLLNNYSNSPAYQKVGGLPIIHLFDMVSSGFSPDDYARVAKELKDERGFVYILLGDSAQRSEYFYDGTNETGAASGMYEWINMGHFLSSPKSMENPQLWEANARNGALRSAQNRNDRIVFGSFYAGFDDRALGGGDWGKGTRRHLPDQDGETLRKTLTYIQQEGFLWNFGITWNDWNEGTELEPSFERKFSHVWEITKFTEKLKGKPINHHLIVDIVEQFTRSQHGGKLDKERQEIFNQAREEIK